MADSGGSMMFCFGRLDGQMDEWNTLLDEWMGGWRTRKWKGGKKKTLKQSGAVIDAPVGIFFVRLYCCRFTLVWAPFPLLSYTAPVFGCLCPPPLPSLHFLSSCESPSLVLISMCDSLSVFSWICRDCLSIPMLLHFFTVCFFFLLSLLLTIIHFVFLFWGGGAITAFI